jgi:transcriptional regulator with XRE-family HTH domain
MGARTVPFEQLLDEKLRDPEFRQAYEELEPAYQVARLRIRRGLTQAQLAELVGTKQPSIARLEGGQVAPRLSFLRRVVEALGGTLTITIAAPDLDEQPLSQVPGSTVPSTDRQDEDGAVFEALLHVSDSPSPIH